MKSEFYTAIATISSERGIPKEAVISSVEHALKTAYKRVSGGVEQNITVRIDPGSGEARVFVHKTVVDAVENDKMEISLADARQIESDAELGGEVLIEDTPRDFGRIAAQTAKQVVLQRIRDYERDTVYEEFHDSRAKSSTASSSAPTRGGHRRAGQGRGGHAGARAGADRALSARPAAEGLPGRGQQDQRGPQLIVSRSHPGLIRRLFELEVPEIFNGAVEIMEVAREPGLRSKVAVAARQEKVDPVGACVGVRGVRIQNIVNELYGEKIDVIEWSPDMATSSPTRSARPSRCSGLERGRAKALVIVPTDQMSLAIGKEGQNARLAYKLTGWRIDIKDPDTAILQEDDAMRAARALLMGAA